MQSGLVTLLYKVDRPRTSPHFRQSTVHVRILATPSHERIRKQWVTSQFQASYIRYPMVTKRHEKMKQPMAPLCPRQYSIIPTTQLQNSRYHDCCSTYISSFLHCSRCYITGFIQQRGIAYLHNKRNQWKTSSCCGNGGLSCILFTLHMISLEYLFVCYVRAARICNNTVITLILDILFISIPLVSC